MLITFFPQFSDLMVCHFM